MLKQLLRVCPVCLYHACSSFSPATPGAAALRGMQDCVAPVDASTMGGLLAARLLGVPKGQDCAAIHSCRQGVVEWWWLYGLSRWRAWHTLVYSIVYGLFVVLGTMSPGGTMNRMVLRLHNTNDSLVVCW